MKKLVVLIVLLLGCGLLIAQEKADTSLDSKSARKAKRKARVEQRVVFRKANYTPSISLGIGDAKAINFEYPIWKWNTMNVSIGKRPAYDPDNRDEVVESMVRVDAGVVVTKDNLPDLKDFEYVNTSCDYCWFGPGRINQLGTIELGKKFFIPFRNTLFSLSLKSYLGQKPAQSIKPYVELGWTMTRLIGKDVDFDIQSVTLYKAEDAKQDYQVFEQVSYGLTRVMWMSNPWANIGLRIQPGKKKRFMMDVKYIFVVPKYYGYVRTFSGGYNQRNDLKNIRISMGWVF